MAFKSINKKQKNYKDIESLFRDLNSKDVESLYSHQSDILRHYQRNAMDKNNVAIELPTGSGKTLVGLLIAEYRRRKYRERTLFLCPTKQLVNQVVNLSNLKYGINCIGFTGSRKYFEESDIFKYKNGDAIGVTTYSSLFNSNPFFSDPDLIVLDDAHTAENYIASCWSLNIKRKEPAFSAIIDLLKSHIEYPVYNRLVDESVDYFDRSIIEKLPNRVLFGLKEELHETFSVYFEEHENLKYTWRMIKKKLEECQLFYSWKGILLRPYIPPSLTNDGFRNAKQRVFMSATLGKGGDLQRITGVNDFYKIPIPDGWDKQGMGRRLFFFPGLSLNHSEESNLFLKLIKRSPRSVILVSNDNYIREIKKELKESHMDIEVFGAKDIEASKEEFVNSKKAIIVLANRFDGIDFSGDESRLLFLKNIPYASNLQEKFLQSRMNASVIFYERNRTRLIQAIGRCTRSPKDFSAICLIGDNDLSEWLLIDDKIKYLHPELQAELEFGRENSLDVNIESFIDNYDEFIGQTDAWKEANEEIIDFRTKKNQEEIKGANELENASKHEVNFIYNSWNKQYDKALTDVENILDKLQGGSELSGYRAFWNYQAASLCFKLYQESESESYADKEKAHLENTIKICPSASWLRRISESESKSISIDENLLINIERLQQFLSWKKINNRKNYLIYLKSIGDYIETNNLENLNLEIGKLLGFKCENPSTEGAPDPYWQSGSNFAIVFEDKFYEKDDENISLKHIRQTKTHKEWVEENLIDLDKNAEIHIVLISNRSSISKESKPYCKSILYWNYENFIEFSKQVLSLARDFQKFYTGKNDENWKNYFLEEFAQKKLNPKEIISNLPLLSSIVND